jgi:hypothetical protein
VQRQQRSHGQSNEDAEQADDACPNSIRKFADVVHLLLRIYVPFRKDYLRQEQATPCALVLTSAETTTNLKKKRFLAGFNDKSAG